MKVTYLKNKKEIIVVLFLILCSIIPISPVLGLHNKEPIKQGLVVNEEESESIISDLEGPDYLQRPQNYQTLSKMISKTETSNIQRGPPPVSVRGTRQLLVILVEFSDVSPNSAHTVAHFNDRFFGNTAPSVRHFFNENSYNKFTYVPGGVMGWYSSSYSQNQWVNKSLDKRLVVVEAINDVDANFNFAPHDRDKNGVVTNEELTIFIIVSGNLGGAFHWYTKSHVNTADGVKVEGEFSATNENRHIGSYCHELGHDLGLPDLYDTNGGSNGIGNYGLMGGGSWTFSHMTAWSKIQLGWITPTIVQESGYYYVSDAESNAQAYILADPTYSNTEYFLVENRRPTNSFYETTGSPIAPSGTYPDEGIVIYHIDETKMQDWITSGTNNVNHDEAHKGVDVECADSPTSHVINADDLDTITNRGDTNDLWDNGEYEFNDTSTPCNAQWYGGINSGISIRVYYTPSSRMKVFFSISEDSYRTEIAWWKFDEGSGTVLYDASPNNNYGYMKNMNSNDWIRGKWGYALNFDGSNDYIRTYLDYDQGGTTLLTISAWLYPTSTSSGRHNVLSTDNGGFDWSLLREGNKWHLFTGRNSINTGQSVDLNRWQHIVAMWIPGVGVRFYKNGILKYSSSTIGYDDSDNRLNIGRNPGYGEYFAGRIDDVRLYQKALSQDEITWIYNDGNGRPDSLTLFDDKALRREYGWWKFDEGSGTVIDDSSIYNNQGTMKNMYSNDWVSGKRGYSLNFDGSNDYVSTNLNYDQRGFTCLIISAWIYPTSTSSGRHHVVSTDNGGFDWSLLREGNRWYMFTGTNSINTGQSVDLNRWQHIVAMWIPDAGVRFYKNGILKFRSSTIGYDSSDNRLNIGRNPGYGEYFAGRIDDVRLYRKILSQDEINWLYNDGHGSTDSLALIDDRNLGRERGWWKFDEGSGSIIDDASIYNNHGTMKNMYSNDWVWGKRRYSLNFDGSNDYISTNLNYDQSGITSLVISAWVYPSSTSSGRHHVVSTDNGGYDWSLLREGNKWHLFTGTNSINTGQSVDLNRWQHIVAMWIPGVGVRFYKNGILKFRSSTIGYDYSDNRLNIGRNPGYGEYFAGRIDDVRLYRKILSQEEINWIYNNGYGTLDSLTFMNNIPPIVSIISPMDEATVNNYVTVRVSVKDEDGIKKVEFYIDNILMRTDFGGKYFYNWDTTNHRDKKYQIKVIAYDIYGKTKSTTCDVNVDNDPIEIIDDLIDYINDEIDDKKTKKKLTDKLEKKVKKHLLKNDHDKVEKELKNFEKMVEKAKKNQISDGEKNIIFKKVQKIRNAIL